MHAAAVTASFTTVGHHPDDLCELIHFVVCEELHKVCGPSQPMPGSIPALVCEEAQKAFQGHIPTGDGPPPLREDYHCTTYVKVARRPAPTLPPPVNATPSVPLPQCPYRQAPVQKASVWHTPNR